MENIFYFQLVILDIPDSGAYFVFDGDNITKEEIFQFIGQICPQSYFAFSFSAPLKSYPWRTAPTDAPHPLSVCLNIYIYMYTCMYRCICIYVCMCLCIYVCMYVYMLMLCSTRLYAASSGISSGRLRY